MFVKRRVTGLLPTTSYELTIDVDIASCYPTNAVGVGGPPGEGVPLVVFAVPNQAEARNAYEIAIPRQGSVILTHSLDGEIPPLSAVAPEDRPPSLPCSSPSA